jgi:Tol biopolymer transport system component
LQLLDSAGRTSELASRVGEATLAPDGQTVGYTLPGSGVTDVMAIEVELRTRYRLIAEPGRAVDLAWSPDGQRLAYRTPALDPSISEVRVLTLTSGSALTVARGDTTAPRWLDESHLVFASDTQTQAGTYARAYRVSALVQGDALSPAQALPVSGTLDVRDPAPSPDGHQIAFLAGEAGNFELWLMNADGTGLVQLTDYDAAAFPYSVRALAWTPA